MTTGTNSGIQLAANRYGKSRVRLVKVDRRAEHHVLSDWTVQILLAGDFASAHIEGDNSHLLPTDTMKNTVYSRARESSAASIEQFAMELAEFFLARNPQVHSAEVTIESALWKRLSVDGKPHPTAFMHGSDEVQTTVVSRARSAGSPGAPEPVRITSGLDRMLILKTADSGFEGFLQDSLTTLKETGDRLLGTELRAAWRYIATANSLDFNRLRGVLRETMLRVFAGHNSRSVQHTLYAMGEAALQAVPQIDEIDLLMPNKHCLLVDLSRFGQDNPNHIFVPTDEPHGTIQATLRRSA